LLLLLLLLRGQAHLSSGTKDKTTLCLRKPLYKLLLTAH
jgi:hypothetical protein